MYAGPIPSFVRAVEDRHPRALARRAGRRSRPCRPASRRRSRARGRAAVSSTAAERLDHRLEVLALVVRREAQDRARHRRIIAGCLRRCPETASSRTSSTSSPTSPRSSRRSRSRSSRTAALRDASASPRCRSPSSRSRGRRSSFLASARRSRAKVVEVVEDGEMHALTKRRGLVPAGVVDFLRLPGVGPKTAARIWTQLGITSLDGLKTRRRGTAARPLGHGRPERGEDPRGARSRSGRQVRRAAAPRPGVARGQARRVRARRRTRLRSPCPRRAAFGVAARPCAISISSRPRAIRPP